jgi:hypothetical protein
MSEAIGQTLSLAVGVALSPGPDHRRDPDARDAARPDERRGRPHGDEEPPAPKWMARSRASRP